MDIYEKTVKFVDDSFKGVHKPHFERTVYWYEQFLPEYTEAHKIAAYAHDIERAFRNKDNIFPEDYLDSEFLKHHQEEGARLMVDFLKKQQVLIEVIEKVSHLISKHEVGGDNEQNALMDADSVSFFETNAENFVTKKAPIEGKEKVKAKLDWMFDRIQSTQAKKAASENYRKWIDVLMSGSLKD